MDFLCIRFFEISYDIFYVWPNLRYSLVDSVLLLSLFIFNITVTPKITYSYWFGIIFFCFKLKKASNISNYSDLDCLISFFSLKRFSYILIILSFFFLQALNDSSSYYETYNSLKVCRSITFRVIQMISSHTKICWFM